MFVDASHVGKVSSCSTLWTFASTPEKGLVEDDLRIMTFIRIVVASQRAHLTHHRHATARVQSP
jgi:hypothetical protein